MSGFPLKGDDSPRAYFTQPEAEPQSAVAVPPAPATEPAGHDNLSPCGSFPPPSTMPSVLISGPLAHTRGSALGALGYQGRRSGTNGGPGLRCLRRFRNECVLGSLGCRSHWGWAGKDFFQRCRVLADELMAADRRGNA